MSWLDERPVGPTLSELHPELMLPVRVIHLANGKGFAIVDPEDYDWLCQKPWHSDGYGYAMARNGSGHIRMHTVIRGTAGPDHVNRHRLDNRRFNLRFVAQKLNAVNNRLSSRNTSGYKGVGKHRQYDEGWIVSIASRSRTSMYLAAVADPIEGAYAYDRAARRLWGEHACTNQDLGLVPPDDGHELAILHAYPSYRTLCLPLRQETVTLDEGGDLPLQ